MPEPPRQGQRPPGDDQPRRFPGNLLLLGLLAAVLITLAMLSFTPPALSYAEFASRWDAKAEEYRGVASARLVDDRLIVTLKPGEAPGKPGESPQRMVHLPPQAIDSGLLKQLARIPQFTVDNTSAATQAFLLYFAPTLALFALFYFLMVRPLRGASGPGNVMAFGRSKPKLIAKEHTGIRFDDVAGIDEAKEEVTEVIEFLRNPQKFSRLGGRIPRGLLFVGPPGTGKTLLAKAIADEAEVPFYSIAGSDFVEMFVGVGASRVRDLFRQAKDHAPCIVFLDEVDAVGRRRGSGLGGGHDEREQTLNAILVEMDGFDTNEQVVVIASTNRPDTLDPALLRPGRFDREVVVGLPELKGRHEILKVHARKVKLADGVDLHRIARATPMFSGAELEALVNEAAIRAAMAGQDAVELADLEEARDKVRFGRAARSRTGDAEELRATAFHEAGHALLMLATPHAEPLHKVTIIPRGQALGMAMQLPAKDRHARTRSQLMAMIQVCFGGRIAEQMFLGDITTGALGDIQQATALARSMVCDYGMSQLGPIRYANKEQQVFLGGELSHPREISEETAAKIDAEVRRIVDECHAAAERLLTERRADVELLAQTLLLRETLSAEEVAALFRDRALPDAPPAH